MHWMPYLGTFKHIFSHSQTNKEVIMTISYRCGYPSPQIWQIDPKSRLKI